MSAKTTPAFIAALKRKKACPEAIEWASKFTSPRKAWKACKTPEWMLWAIHVFDLDDDVKLRKIACRCVRDTTLADGRKVWDLLTDERSRNAVEVSERFADSKATKEELDAVMAVALAAFAVAPAAAIAAAAAAHDAPAAAFAASAAARAAAFAAAHDAPAALAAARAGQANIIREIYGGYPFTAEMF